MDMPEEVARASDALLATLKKTEVFRQYAALRHSVLSDEVNRKLIERFTRAQSALQMAALAGTDPCEEDAAEFERLSALLYQNPDTTDYLLAQMRVQQLVAATMDKLTQQTGIAINIRDL